MYNSSGFRFDIISSSHTYPVCPHCKRCCFHIFLLHSFFLDLINSPNTFPIFHSLLLLLLLLHFNIHFFIYSNDCYFWIVYINPMKKNIFLVGRLEQLSMLQRKQSPQTGVLRAKKITLLEGEGSPAIRCPFLVHLLQEFHQKQNKFILFHFYSLIYRLVKLNICVA